MTEANQTTTPKIETREDLEKILAGKNEAILALGNLVKGITVSALPVSQKVPKRLRTAGIYLYDLLYSQTINAKL